MLSWNSVYRWGWAQTQAAAWLCLMISGIKVVWHHWKESVFCKQKEKMNNRIWIWTFSYEKELKWGSSIWLMASLELVSNAWRSFLDSGGDIPMQVQLILTCSFFLGNTTENISKLSTTENFNATINIISEHHYFYNYIMKKFIWQ